MNRLLNQNRFYVVVSLLEKAPTRSSFKMLRRIHTYGYFKKHLPRNCYPGDPS